MLFKSRSLLPVLACILATGHLVTSAPHADLSSPEQSPSKDHVIAKRAITMDHWAGSKKMGLGKLERRCLRAPFASAATAKNDVQLVAAIYIASGPGEGIYVSSIPKGLASALMDTADAPAWAHQVAGRTPKTNHAEDGACGFVKTHSAPSSLTRLSTRMAQLSTFMGISKTMQATQSIPTISHPARLWANSVLHQRFEQSGYHTWQLGDQQRSMDATCKVLFELFDLCLFDTMSGIQTFPGVLWRIRPMVMHDPI